MIMVKKPKQSIQTAARTEKPRESHLSWYYLMLLSCSHAIPWYYLMLLFSSTGCGPI